MKKARLLILLSIMACIILSVAACNRPSLSAPVGLYVDDAVTRLSWQGDAEAVSYTIEVSQFSDGKWSFYRESTSDTNSLRIAELPTNYNYRFRVKAVSDGRMYSSSGWSEELECFKPYENGLSFEYIGGGTEARLTSLGTAIPDNGVVEIPSTFRGRTVTEIGNRAFFRQTAITSIIIPNTVKTIGKEAFRECKQLESIEIPDSVTSMDSYTFFGCSKLTDVKLSDSLETIPVNCFGNCINLENIDFGTGVKTIADYAFQNCWTRTYENAGTTDGEDSDKFDTIYHGLINVTLPDSVESIGLGAFSNCQNLETFTCGENLQVIGSAAFGNDSMLSEVNFNDNLLAIEDSAFARCGDLAAIDIPDSVISIGSSAFAYCGSLNDISIGTGVMAIGDDAFAETFFYSNSTDDIIYVGKKAPEGNGVRWAVGTRETTDESGESVNRVHTTPNYTATLEEGTVGIASMAFYYLRTKYNDQSEQDDYVFSQLDSVEIPDSVKYINDGAFRLCTELSQVKLGIGVESIGAAAFEMCYGLRTVDIPDGSHLKTIGPYAFSCAPRSIGGPLGEQLNGRHSRLGQPLGGEGIDDMNLPEGLESIGSFAFYNTYYTEYYSTIVYVGGWAVGTNASSEAGLGAINIEEHPSGYPSDRPIIGIADYAFTEIASPTEISIANSVKRIGIGAFSKCTAVTSVTIPDGVTTINESTFYGCSALLEVNLPQSLREIKELAFYECGVDDDIPAEAEFKVTGLDNVETIGRFVFYGCTHLKEIDLGDNLTELGGEAFCLSGLESITIPDSLTVINNYTFSNCAQLVDVILGSGVETIGDFAFRGCGIENLLIPSNVKTLGDSAFRKCDSMGSLKIEDGLQVIGQYAFYGCELLGLVDSVEIPQSVTTIGDYAFRNCISLTSVVLGDSITSMGMHVFNKCDALVIYTDMTETPEDWNAKWNSSYRPILYGCEIEDGYVSSFTKNESTVGNYFASYSEFSEPIRDGYYFEGWQGSDGEIYTAEELMNAPDNTTLTAIWS